jgi:hypothetical protein
MTRGIPLQRFVLPITLLAWVARASRQSRHTNIHTFGGTEAEKMGKFSYN